MVTQVDPNGLASDQGFKTGDVILEVGGKKVANPVDVRTALSEAQKDGKRTILMRVKIGRGDEVRRGTARQGLTKWGAPSASVAPAGGSNQGTGPSVRPHPF